MLVTLSSHGPYVSELEVVQIHPGRCRVLGQDTLTTLPPMHVSECWVVVQGAVWRRLAATVWGVSCAHTCSLPPLVRMSCG